MDIKNEFKSGMKLAADAATDVAQALVEKSRLRAKANRIKQVIKSDTELRNQAYIELGRYFYDNLRNEANGECESLCVVVDKTTARINKAGRKYVELMSSSSEVKFSSENTEKIKQLVSDKADKIKDTTTDKMNEIKDKAKDTSHKAKEKAVDFSEKAKIKAQDISVKAKETVADISDKAKDKVDDLKAFIAPDEDIEELLEDEDIVETEKTVQKATAAVETLDEDDEESPDEFEF
ncbi:MAG: YtxH domain-containing protein [Ruminococcus sp.]|nr:YtxH domain-containing protein [Ruminococcus sp.]MBQ2972526.1 YtxH domain-containing protein [Ruminococcus sp.]